MRKNKIHDKNLLNINLGKPILFLKKNLQGIK